MFVARDTVVALCSFRGRHKHIIIGVKMMLKVYQLTLCNCRFLLHTNYLNSNYHIDRSQCIWDHYCLSFFFFNLLCMSDFGHRGFTLGELDLVSFGWRVLWLKFLNLINSYYCPITRLSTLSLMITDLMNRSGPLSPCSHNNAQRPVHRFRFPEENAHNRRYFTLCFYIRSLLIIGARQPEGICRR